MVGGILWEQTITVGGGQFRKICGSKPSEWEEDSPEENHIRSLDSSEWNPEEISDERFAGEQFSAGILFSDSAPTKATLCS